MSQTTFNTMVSEIPSAVANINYSINKIDEQITALQLEIDDILNFAAAPLSASSDIYLTTKSAELSASLGGIVTVCTSGGYGTTNLTDWAIVSGGVCSGPVVWSDSSLSIASSGSDLEQYNRQLEFDEISDHLYRDFDESPIATYGIQQNYDSLQTGKNILTRDKDKLETMYDIYVDYVT